MHHTSLFPIYLVGSFPKPSYLKIPSWFDSTQYGWSAHHYTKFVNKLKQSKQSQLSLEKAFAEVIAAQINAGCDIVTDGEIDRENYIWHFCRYCLNGFDFKNLKKIVSRNGATCMYSPRITNKITLKKDALDLIGNQWLLLQQKHNSKPIKIAIPGPMTIMDSTHNEYYANVHQLLFDLANCINQYILNLSENFAVKYIQIDEPIFSRKPDMAKKVGFKAMKMCWQNVPNYVYKSIHLCCGYSNELDIEYEKADNHCYVQLLKYGMDDFLVDECGVHAISIEDAHDRVPMEFFKLVKKLDIILGVIKVCQKQMISTDQIVERVANIIQLGNIEPSKLLLAPDCGLAMLPIHVAKKKLKALVEARNILRRRYQSKL
eukprot:137984_1